MSDSCNVSDISIYFSEFFELDPEVVEGYGAFDVSLISDLPLFIDPFMLFTSTKRRYQELHRQIIEYLQFLLAKSKNQDLNPALIASWYQFKEIKENWLGFSGRGNVGKGLGPKFAGELHHNLASVFQDFGNEHVTRGSHLEKLCLISSGVCRDNISDFTACLIKNYLLEYSQEFAQRFLKPDQVWTGDVERSRFDYQAEVWVSETYQLPKFGSSYVILSPKDMLRREETWINRRELVGNFRQLAASLPDGVLRAQLNNYLAMQLIYAPDATEKERNEKYQRVVNDALFKFPGVIEHYIRQKEDDGDKATAVSSEEVREVADWFVEKVREAVAGVLSPSGFYDLAYNSYAAALERLKFLKRCIEDMDLYRLFYHDDKPIQREQDLQLLYKLTWFGSVFDLNAEVNNGRGPVDFKASRGSQDMSLVEFKLAKNPHLKRSLQNQLAIYERANNTKKSIWGIFFFSSEEERRASGILTEVGMAGADNVVMIDCRDDNKPSASHA